MLQATTHLVTHIRGEAQEAEDPGNRDKLLGAARGVADAKATEIYARAYSQNSEAVAFYEFTRTMQSYKSIISKNTTLVLSTESDLFKFLKGMDPDGDIAPVRRSGKKR